MKAFIKHILLLVAALSLFSCRKDAPAGKWVLAEYTCKSDKSDQRNTSQYDDQGRITRATEDTKDVITMYLTYSYEQNTITRLMLLDLSKPEEWDTKTVFTLDNAGRVVKAVEEDTQKTRIYTYSPDGFLVKVTDAEGKVTVYSWKNNSLEKIVRPDGSTVKYTYSNKESLGLYLTNDNEKGDYDLARMGYFGKNSRLLPAKIEDVTADGKVVLTREYNYTEFDAHAHLLGYTETTTVSMVPPETTTTETYKLTWKNLP